MSETTQPHVLLVDDVAIYLSLAQILFARLAVTLVVAGGGREALAACERQTFDLIPYKQEGWRNSRCCNSRERFD